MTLLYYKKERGEYPIEFGKNLSVMSADSIIKKLIKHYKIKGYTWKFVGTTSSRCWSLKKPNKPITGILKFSRTHTSIGVICHELAHAIEMTKYGKSGHAGRHFRIMARLIKYCNKQGYVPGRIIW